tara:strand:+ start:1014 stop:1349 length:336 start_codon:yes stop_codon:yes gene_type:complete
MDKNVEDIVLTNKGVVGRITAVQSLGFYNFNVSEDGECVFPDGVTPPTVSEIDTEIVRLKKEYTDNEYARNRASAFPSIGDQLDMQYHDQLDGTTTWKDAIAKVKSDNPKE